MRRMKESSRATEGLLLSQDRGESVNGTGSSRLERKEQG